MNERPRIAEGLGDYLAGFTGENVGEPRVFICLYGPPPPSAMRSPSSMAFEPR